MGRVCRDHQRPASDTVGRAAPAAWIGRAAQRGYRREHVRAFAQHVETADDAIYINPAVFDPRVAFGHVRRNTRHFGALPWEKVPELWVWLQTASCHEQTRQLVMLLALNAKRTSEARFARAEFLSSDGKVWTTPAELMKRAREHRVQPR